MRGNCPSKGVEPFAQAQVTAGGALAREFSPQTLESLRVPGCMPAAKRLILTAIAAVIILCGLG